MLWEFIIGLGLVAYFIIKNDEINRNSRQAELELQTKHSHNLEAIKSHISKNEQILQQIKTERAEWQQEQQQYLNCIAKFKASYFQGKSYLSKMFDELVAHYDNAKAEFQLSKKHPAPKASEEIKRLSKEKRALLAENKFLQCQIDTYKARFPEWFEQYEQDILNEVVSEEDFKEPNSEYHDEVRQFLTQEEYEQLPPSNKHELALQRYLSGKLNKHQVGKLYEYDVGNEYEEQGYLVEYHGIKHKKADNGIDLICHKNNEILIIQAKCWSKNFLIRENTVFQLFGTATQYRQRKADLIQNVRMLLITSTQLSDEARFFAQILGVEIIENRALRKDFPMIKCNISAKTGERIYHLPFDEQYDRVIINRKQGEFYALTVFEAEFNGFRRAFRYFKKKK